MMYRIRYYSDGGPVAPVNDKGWPAWGKRHGTLFGVMKELRDVLCRDARVGTVLGVAVQYRLAGGEWRTATVEETNRDAKTLRLEGWRELKGS